MDDVNAYSQVVHYTSDELIHAALPNSFSQSASPLLTAIINVGEPGLAGSPLVSSSIWRQAAQVSYEPDTLLPIQSTAL